MKDVAFVGRRAEISVLERALDHVLEGSGRLLLIGGPPGIGKTALADELAARAGNRACIILWGRSWEGGGAPAYTPWAEALRSLVRQQDPARVRERLGRAARSIAVLAPELDEVLGPSDSDTGDESESARFRMFRAVTDLLVEAASERPVILVLEDVHASDTASLLLLRFLARRLSESRIMVVATYREMELGQEASAALADLMRERVARRIVLGGLGRVAVRELVQDACGKEPPDRLVEAIHRHTDGNPLFLHAVIEDLGDDLEDGSEAARIAVPRELRRAILDAIGRLSPACGDVLSLAAVAGRDFRIDVIDRVQGVPERLTAGSMDEAKAAGVIESVPDRVGQMRFAHGLIREVLYEELPPRRRSELHGRVGEVLEEMYANEPGEHAAELAYHFLSAIPAGDTERAVRYAGEAGDGAMRLLAFEQAAHHYRAALEALRGGADSHDRAGLLLSLGEALARAGEQDASRAVFLEAAGIAERSGAAQELARAALGYGGRFVWTRAGGDPHVRRLLDGALDALPEEDGILRARVMARLAGILRDDPAREPRWSLSREAIAVARRLGDPGTIAYTLESRWAAIWEPGTGPERLEIANELVRFADTSADPERSLQAHGYRLHTLFEMGELEGVRAEHRAEQRLLETVRQPAQRWLVAAGSAGLALFEGRFAEAEDRIAEAVELGRRAQTIDAEVSFRLQTYLLLREKGGLDKVEPVLRGSIEAFPWYPMFRCALADLYARTGRAEEAQDLLTSLCADEVRALPFDSQWLFSISLLADAVSTVDDPSHASVLYPLLSPWARLTAYSAPEGSTGSVARSLGQLAATLGRWDEAAGHFEAATQRSRDMGALPWLAHSLVGYASALLGRDEREDRERAASLLADGDSLARRLEMGPLRKRIAGLRGRAGARAEQAAAARGAGAAAAFRREGEWWSIAFEGRSFHLSDSKGMRYLSQLLHNPGREILALDLVATAAGEAPGRTASGEGLDVVGADGGDVIDPAARAAYRRRLDELREELEEAEDWSDPGRAARARAEMEFIAGELSAATGLGGRTRKMGSPAERARQSVTKALKLAIERIEREDRAMGRHLRATVRTGTFCSYLPDPRAEIAWASTSSPS